MKINIFLDDLRKCPENFKLFRTGEELIEFLKNNPQDYGIITFDHDLGENNIDGYQVIKEIVNMNNITFQEFRFHTDNPTGFKNMVLYLLNAKKAGIFSSNINPYKFNSIDGIISQEPYSFISLDIISKNKNYW